MHEKEATNNQIWPFLAFEKDRKLMWRDISAQVFERIHAYSNQSSAAAEYTSFPQKKAMKI